MRASLARNLKTSLLLFGFLAIAYFPTLANIYDYHDSYHFFDYTEHAQCSANPLLPIYALFGRPMNGLLYCLSVAKLMGGTWTAGWIRLGSLMCLTVAAFMTRSYLKRSGLSGTLATLAAATAFMFPGTQQTVYASHGAPLAIGILLPIGAVLAFEQVNRALARARPVETLWWFTCVVGGLTLSSLNYQSLTEIFLALIFIRCLMFSRDDTGRLIPFLLWALAAYVLHGMAYLAIHYIFDLPYIASRMDIPLRGLLAGSRSISVTSDIAAHSPVLWSRALRALTLWFYGSGVLVAGSVAVAAAILYIWGTVRILTDSAALWARLRRVVTPVVLLALFTLLTNAAAVAVAVDPEGLFDLFRTMIAFQWVIWFFIVWTWGQTQRSVPSRLRTVACWGIMAVISAFVHTHLYYNMVGPNAQELDRLTKAISESKGRRLGTLCVIQPAFEVVGYIGGFHVIDEFGRTSLMYEDDVPSMVYAVAHHLSIPRSELDRIVALRDRAAVSASNCTTVVDMRRNDGG